VIPWRLLIFLLHFLLPSHGKDVSCLTSAMMPLTNHFLIYALLTSPSRSHSHSLRTILRGRKLM
jgi:hypothetical protein